MHGNARQRRTGDVETRSHDHVTDAFLLGVEIERHL
jgi:hypothetical protein